MDEEHDAKDKEIQLAVDMWNTFAGQHGLCQIRTLTDSRRAALKARLKEGLQTWAKAIEMIGESPFCLGENDRKWRANFDFLVRASSFTKVLEGAYQQAAPPGHDPMVGLRLKAKSIKAGITSSTLGRLDVVECLAAGLLTAEEAHIWFAKAGLK